MAEKSDSGMPREMAALWASRERPRRGPKPAMSVDAIVAAAIAVADAEGLDAISMGRVAKELGYTPMSLYRYVSSKSVLLMLMLDAVIGDPPTVRDDEAWRVALERWSLEQLRVFARHPWALQVSITGLTLSPHRLSWLDRGFAILSGTTLDEGEKAASLLTLASFILGEARLARDLQHERGDYELVEGATPSFGQLMARLVDAERLPFLAKAVSAGAFDDPNGYTEADTAFGLHRILDGIGLLITKAQRAQRDDGRGA